MRTDERFFAKVRERGACWVWRGGTGSGYGRFRSGGRNVGAHRYSWTLFKGPIPDGLQLDHLCRNRLCVNPDHLEPVTPHVNQKRMAAANPRTECKRGHGFSEENTYVHAKTGFRQCRTCNAERVRVARGQPLVSA